MSRHDAFLQGFSERWLDAWNSHDTEQVLALVAPDIVWEDLTFWPEVINGQDTLREYVDHIWSAMPDVQFRDRGRFFDPEDRRGIFLFQQSGSAPAVFPDSPGFDHHGCDIFLAFDGDLLSHYLASYDITPMMVQMGLLPARGGKRGGAYLLSLAAGAVSA